MVDVHSCLGDLFDEYTLQPLIEFVQVDLVDVFGQTELVCNACGYFAEQDILALGVVVDVGHFGQLVLHAACEADRLAHVHVQLRLELGRHLQHRLGPRQVHVALDHAEVVRYLLHD